MTDLSYDLHPTPKPRLRLGLIILGGVTLLVVALAVFQFVILPQILDKAIRGAPQPPAVVSAAPATSSTWSQRIEAIGSIEAVQGVSITAEVGGKLTAILFQSGQQVRKGDALVRLDGTTQAADVARFQADARNAELTYNRQAQLRRQGWASQATLDQARAQLDQARAQVAFAQADGAKRVIRAPFSGRLGIRQVDLGGYLNPGQTIVSLQTVDPIFASFSLPEQDVSRLKVGQNVEVTVSSRSDRVFAGQITSIDSTVDPNSRNIRVQATLANPDGLLTPGQSAQVAVVTPGGAPAVSVPETAVAYNMYGNIAYVLKPDPESKDGKNFVAESRVITVGNVKAGRVQILSGLKAGEQVVTAGQNKLRDGAKAAINNSVVLDTNRAMPRE